MAPDWSTPFRLHVDVMKTAAGGTRTQIDHLGREPVIAYYSKHLKAAEENYTSNDCELLGLVYFLKIFMCYLEGTTFEVITDNQVLRKLFTKKNLSRREARWLDLFAKFNLDKITLVQGRIHVLGDAQPRIPQQTSIQLSNIHVATFYNTFRENYKTDQFFSPVIKALDGEFSEDAVASDNVKYLLSRFRYE